MKMKPNPVCNSLCLALFLLAGCSTSPKANFYTLSGSPQPLPTASAAPYQVAIGPLNLPEMLDRPQIVTRISPNQVTFSESERWAEPLKNAIPRLLAEQLTQRLGARISVYPQAAESKDISLNLTLLHFESQPGEAATVELQWTLRRSKDGVLREGHALAREAVANGSYEALVAAHARALNRIGAQIAESIQSARP
jgi:uncharacterized lipoprotein YmbA